MTDSRFSRYVHTRGTDIVDPSGTPLLLRGIGLGNWLLPEGYMWGFGDEMSSPRQIEHRVETLIGPARAAEFWTRYRNSFITEADVACIAELGFDHVRLPINARGVIDDDGAIRPEGFAQIDDAVNWCENHGLWILLDLHGAPGGQTGTNIDDSPNGKPELFMNDTYRQQTLALWRAIATRYRSRTAVLGYDLLNEPLPNEWQYRYADELIDLYKDLTATIREVDPDHLIMYEGAHWATNWSMFTETIDSNSVLQFHRYWCAPDQTSIQEYLDARDRLNLPIYMGEGGENTPEWIYAATRLYEAHNIGWNFWPWKKLDTRTSPVSVTTPTDWHLIATLQETPDPETSWSILTQFLNNIVLAQCESRPEVTNALFARAPLHLAAWGSTDEDQRRYAVSIPEGMWHHTAGEPYSDAELIGIELDTGAEMYFPLQSEPSMWDVHGAGRDKVDVQWNGRGLVATALSTATLTGLSIHQ